MECLVEKKRERTLHLKTSTGGQKKESEREERGVCGEERKERRWTTSGRKMGSFSWALPWTSS